MAAEFIYTCYKLARFYPPDRTVLENISLSFYPGAKIGVLGSNGSGKSSLLKIMAGIDDGFTLVFAAHPKKDVTPMIRRLAAHAGHVILTTTPPLRAPEEIAAMLAGRANVEIQVDPVAALAKARAMGAPVVVAGSLYLAGAILAGL